MKRILLIVTGGIAAYKALDLVRRLRERGLAVTPVLTRGGAEFVTPLSLSALSEEKCYTDLFDLTDEAEMGHIQLSRSADLVLVAPASADILAKMTHGLADDLATTLLLATDTPVMAAPAMNVRMWEHPATKANVETLKSRGVAFVGPVEGNMACGEYGMGRFAEPQDIVDAVQNALGSGGPESDSGSKQYIQESSNDYPLSGRRAIVTSGPTHEAIDPVRYIANRSSGKQGHAIAAALAGLGADTTLVTGPTTLTDPMGVTVVHIQSADEMMQACREALPADIAVCAAAVADWRVADIRDGKIKKRTDGTPPALELVENPDILASLSRDENARPALVVGFAAETENVAEQARAKRARKACDWIVANDVGSGTDTFGGDSNTVHLIGPDFEEAWPRMTKQDVATRLGERIAGYFAGNLAENLAPGDDGTHKERGTGE